MKSCREIDARSKKGVYLLCLKIEKLKPMNNYVWKKKQVVCELLFACKNVELCQNTVQN